MTDTSSPEEKQGKKTSSVPATELSDPSAAVSSRTIKLRKHAPQSAVNRA